MFTRYYTVVQRLRVSDQKVVNPKPHSERRFIVEDLGDHIVSHRGAVCALITGARLGSERTANQGGCQASESRSLVGASAVQEVQTAT